MGPVIMTDCVNCNLSRRCELCVLESFLADGGCVLRWHELSSPSMIFLPQLYTVSQKHVSIKCLSNSSTAVKVSVI